MKRIPPTHLLPWLTCETSLTEKLEAKSGEATLQVLFEHWLGTTSWDQCTLSLGREQVLHRDILMLAWNEPCWYARTILPLKTYQADKKLFARLKQEPLGHLIFAGNGIVRVSLRHYSIGPHDVEYGWLPALQQKAQATYWVRLSCFKLSSGQLFYLLEILLPGLENYCQ